LRDDYSEHAYYPTSDCGLLHPTIYLFSLVDWSSRLPCRRCSHMERPTGRWPSEND